MKNIFACLLILISISLEASSEMKGSIVDVIHSEGRLGRDSGEPVTKNFINGCITKTSDQHYILQCDDLLFIHYITAFYNSKKEAVLLITEDGASVENRWVYLLQNNDYKKITDTVLPRISDLTISQLLRKVTKSNLYTEKYVESVAHSSYRLRHNVHSLSVVSGIPDENYETKLGILNWNGDAFEFTQAVK